MRLRHASIPLKTLLLSATLLAGAGLASAGSAWADVDDGVADNNGQLPLPSGQYITPTAATGSTFQKLNPNNPQYPSFRPNGAIATVRSPDGKTLLVMTSGYNTLDDAQGHLAATANSEYIFVFDVSNPRAPVQRQVLTPANTYAGLVWAPDGSKFYASGGNDDQVIVYSGTPGGAYAVSATIPLGHKNAVGLQQAPQASGLAVSQDGSLLVVANMLNDSISVVSTATNAVLFEYDLRPYNTNPATGNGVAGGEYISSVAIKGDSTIYAASLRDREVVVVDISSGTPRLTTRIPLPGNPVNVLLNRTQDTLYVAQDNSDQVAVINTAANTVSEEISAIAPPGLLADTANRYTGASTNNVALSPDESTLYVTNGGANSLAIVPLSGPAPHAVAGLVPTGWYPTSVSVSADGGTLWVANNKSDPGANPGHVNGSTARLTQTTFPGGNAAAATASYASNQYVFQLEQSGLLTTPVPAAGDLSNLTRQVAANDGYDVVPNPQDAQVMGFLHAHITNVIYIVKENRTFDQVLGDLANGSNGDPNLTVFGRRITPNFHRISTNFVTLDNFFDSGEVSGNGWPWSTGGRETDWVEKTIPMNYSFGVNRGNAPYDAEGQNSNVSVGYDGVAARQDEQPSYTAASSGLPGGTTNLLPGTNDVGAPDGKNGVNRQAGHIWDAALRAGLTIRDYGFFSDNGRYDTSIPGAVPLLENPAATNTQVQFPTSPALIANFDPYFRGFDNAFPDVWRYEEFAREFAGFDANKTMPNLVMLRYMHDHMGNFTTAVAGVNTPETQQADNDYAVGRTLQMIAQSKNYAQNTLIVVIEDDAQDGPDHMDAHRSTAYVVGPYVKHRAVVSTRYSTINMLRTIEDVLGLEHLNLNTAYQRPMTDVFDTTQPAAWTYTAVASTILNSTSLILSDLRDGKVKFAEGPEVKPAHDAAYWTQQTRGFDWSAEDRVPAELFNRVLWEGLKGGVPYPAERSGQDLRGASPAVQPANDAGTAQN